MNTNLSKLHKDPFWFIVRAELWQKSEAGSKRIIIDRASTAKIHAHFLYSTNVYFTKLQKKFLEIFCFFFCKFLWGIILYIKQIQSSAWRARKAWKHGELCCFCLDAFLHPELFEYLFELMQFYALCELCWKYYGLVQVYQDLFLEFNQLVLRFTEPTWKTK